MKLPPLRLSLLLGLLGVSIAIATYASMSFDHESTEWYGPNHPTRTRSAVNVTFDRDFSDFICPGTVPPPPVIGSGPGSGPGGSTGGAP